jgi:hypothetical protein
MQRPAREREEQGWAAREPQATAPAGLAVRRESSLARRRAQALARPLRRRARKVLAGVHVLVLVSALFGALASHAILAQLSPPSPPSAVCGSSSLDGPSSPPAGAVTVPAGDNSAVDFTTPDTTYWFAAGTHTLGSGQFSQIDPGDNSVFEGAPGAILNGQSLNQFAFAGSATGVTIEYLTIENFIPPGAQGAVNINGEPGWTLASNTIQDNLPGAGTMVGSDNVITGNCLTENGEYGFNAYTVNDVSAVTSGPSDITMTGNEISYNNTCNWEDDASFPITPPAGCTGAGQFVGCGCSGGGKFWEADQGTFAGNYVLDNYSVGAWWDTNDNGWAIDGNYFSGNYAGAVQYEISYNAQINDNTFVDNAILAGPTNPGFPSSAVYISESGSDSRVPGSYGSSFEIEDNGFYDNWGGVILWENANRYCGSTANSSSGACTLVNPQATLQTCGAPYPVSQQGPARGAVPNTGRRGRQPSAGSGSGQSFIPLLNYTPYINDCRWKTQNVTVSGNLFDFDASDIGASCTTENECGFNGVFSQYGTYPPYLGDYVENDITFSQDNVFSGNTYCGPWQFMALQQGNVDTYATWTSSPYDQDSGSTLNGPSCTAPVQGPLPPAPGGQARRIPVTIPYRAGRR